MTAAEIAISLLACMFGVGLGTLLMAGYCIRAERIGGAAAKARIASLQDSLDYAQAETETILANIASLQATIDDQAREVSRLTGEKHARDVVINQGIEVLQSLHAQGDRP